MTASTEASTWDDEKREVWQSVIEAMREPDLDNDRASACRYLLSHLAGCPPYTSAMMYS
jgi:hypothetical protein